MCACVCIYVCVHLPVHQGADFLESVDAIQYRAVCAAPKGVTDTALNEIRKSEKRKSTSVAFTIADLEKEQERRAKVSSRQFEPLLPFVS